MGLRFTRLCEDPDHAGLPLTCSEGTGPTSPDEKSHENRGRMVLSELKHHLGTEADFCYPSLDKKWKRKASTNELSLLCSIYDQEANEDNGTWLYNLLLPTVPAYL